MTRNVPTLHALITGLALLIMAPGMASAQSGRDPVPRLDLSTGELTFDKAGDARTLTLKNSGKGERAVPAGRVGRGSGAANPVHRPRGAAATCRPQFMNDMGATSLAHSRTMAS